MGVTELKFNPSQIMENTNLSTLHNGPLIAMTRSTDSHSRIFISQPKKNGYMTLPDTSGGSSPATHGANMDLLDYSQRLWLISDASRSWADQRAKELEKKLKMGVGIGVGLGVPILLAVVWFATRRSERRKVRAGTTVEAKRGSMAT